MLHDNPGDGTGDYNISGALTVSSDAFFYNLGDLFYNDRGNYGQDAIQNEGAQYGEGMITGIDLPGEAQGRIDSQTDPTEAAPAGTGRPSRTPPGTPATTSRWPSARAQPCLRRSNRPIAYATFANGGTRYAPQVASEVVNPMTGKVVQKFEPNAIGHVAISPTNYSAILQGLEGVISNQNGTAYGDFVGFPSSWNLAGKTGTASNQANQEPNSWFVAFGPNPNPQYLVLAVIGQGGYGASAAAPLVRNIFDYIAANQPQISSGVKTPTPSSPPSNYATDDHDDDNGRKGWDLHDDQHDRRRGPDGPLRLRVDGDPLAPDRATSAEGGQAGALHRG